MTCARLNGEERQSRQVAGLLFRIDTFSRGEVFEEGVSKPIQCIIGKNINSLKECFKLDKTCSSIGYLSHSGFNERCLKKYLYLFILFGINPNKIWLLMKNPGRVPL